MDGPASRRRDFEIERIPIQIAGPGSIEGGRRRLIIQILTNRRGADCRRAAFRRIAIRNVANWPPGAERGEIARLHTGAIAVSCVVAPGDPGTGYGAAAAAIADHAGARTTQLYDRRRDEMAPDKVERTMIKASKQKGDTRPLGSISRTRLEAF